MFTLFPPPPKIRGEFLIFEIWTKRGVMKKLLRIVGLVEKGGGGSKLFHHFSLRKACFNYYWNTFFCLVNITIAVINRSILSYGLPFTRK